jgi:acyl-CoA thioester hydrolase
MNEVFYKEFEVRWSDVDANRHLGNFAYINMMSHTRMSLLNKIGFGHHAMHKAQIGPVLFREEIHYFKEVLPGTPLKVSGVLKRVSEDHKFFCFEHRFYADSGENVAYGEITGSWISLSERKLIAPPQALRKALDEIPKSGDYRMFHPEEIRIPDIYPVHLTE